MQMLGAKGAQNRRVSLERLWINCPRCVCVCVCANINESMKASRLTRKEEA